MLGRLAGALAALRVGVTPGEDASAGVRTVRGGAAEGARRGQTGDVRLSGFHAYVREDAEGRSVLRPTQVDSETLTSEAPEAETGAPTAAARPRARPWALAAARGNRVVQLPC